MIIFSALVFNPSLAAHSYNYNFAWLWLHKLYILICFCDRKCFWTIIWACVWSLWWHHRYAVRKSLQYIWMSSHAAHVFVHKIEAGYEIFQNYVSSLWSHNGNELSQNEANRVWQWLLATGNRLSKHSVENFARLTQQIDTHVLSICVVSCYSQIELLLSTTVTLGFSFYLFIIQQFD